MRALRPSPLATLALFFALLPVTVRAATTLAWQQPPASSQVDVFRVYKGPSVAERALVWTGLPQADALGIYSADVQIDEVDAGIPVYVWVTAVNQFGESPLSNANFYPGCDPAVDSDCDGIPDDGAPGQVPCATGQTLDCDDNCPYWENPDQRDRGGIRAGSPPDGIGDECQCGDVNADGRVTSQDSVMIMRALVVPPQPMLRPDLCDVAAPQACTSADAVRVLQAQLTPPPATIVQQCDPALMP